MVNALDASQPALPFRLARFPSVCRAWHGVGRSPDRIVRVHLKKLSHPCSAAGPLFAVVLGAAALGASLVFSTAAFFILVPLALAALPLTFGVFAGAFVLKGIVSTLFNLVSTSFHHQHDEPPAIKGQAWFDLASGTTSSRASGKAVLTFPPHKVAFVSPQKLCCHEKHMSAGILISVAAAFPNWLTEALLVMPCAAAGGGSTDGRLPAHKQSAGQHPKGVS